MTDAGFASSSYKGKRRASSIKTKLKYGGAFLESEALCGTTTGEGEGVGVGEEGVETTTIFAHSPETARPFRNAQPSSPVQRQAQAAHYTCNGLLTALASPALRRRCISHPVAEFSLMVATLWALFFPHLIGTLLNVLPTSSTR